MDLVTGADGFIGSHLAEALVRSGRKVRAFAQYNARNHWGWLEDLDAAVLGELDVCVGDLRDSLSVLNAVKGCDRVFHLGALIAIPYSYRAPSEYVSTNVGGTLHVMQAALSEGVSVVVHTSTSEVYGTARRIPMDEGHPLQAQSPYAASKIAADKIVESFSLSFDLPAVTVRPFNTYGPRQSARAVIPTIITQALSEQQVRLGSLEPIRDLTYVDDTVSAFIRAAETPAAIGTVINVGQGIGITIGELARLIISLLGHQIEVASDPVRMRPPNSEVEQLVCDNSKARALLGWEPRVELREGLEKTIDWFRTHLSLYKADVYNV